MVSTENNHEDGEPEYELIDAADLPRQAPRWLGWALVGTLLLGALFGAGGVLLSGLTIEDLRNEPTPDASPVATTICSAAANVRSTDSISGDVVDTLEFGDEVAGMLSGAWLKLDEGRYISVSVLCDLSDPIQAGGDSEQVSASAEPTTTDTDETTATAETTEEVDDRAEGTFVTAGTGTQIVELPEDARSGMLEFEHTGSGDMTITGRLESGTEADPDLQLEGDTSGTTVFGLSDEVHTIEVASEGEWTLRVAPLDTVPEMTESIGAPATAAFYLGGDADTWRFQPSTAMLITQYAEDGTSASAQIEGTSRVEMQPGGSYVVVYTSGPWTADVVEQQGDDASVTSAPAP